MARGGCLVGRCGVSCGGSYAPREPTRSPRPARLRCTATPALSSGWHADATARVERPGELGMGRLHAPEEGGDRQGKGGGLLGVEVDMQGHLFGSGGEPTVGRLKQMFKKMQALGIPPEQL